MHSIVEQVQEAGIVYDTEHRKFLQKCWDLQERFSAWSEDDFECEVVNGRVYNIDSGVLEPDSDPKVIQAADAKKLQNYGRPYSDNEQVKGTYYKHAKKSIEVDDFC